MASFTSTFPHISPVKSWSGGETALWDLDHSVTFKNLENGEDDVFVPGDEVVFDDSALTTDVVISGNLKPSSVTFSNNEKTTHSRAKEES